MTFSLFSLVPAREREGEGERARGRPVKRTCKRTRAERGGREAKQGRHVSMNWRARGGAHPTRRDAIRPRELPARSSRCSLLGIRISSTSEQANTSPLTTAGCDPIHVLMRREFEFPRTRESFPFRFAPLQTRRRIRNWNSNSEIDLCECGQDPKARNS